MSDSLKNNCSNNTQVFVLFGATGDLSLRKIFPAWYQLQRAGKCKHAYTVFYQDGIWKDKEQETATTGLLINDRLFLCGTAPALTQLGAEERVFVDVKGCIGGLLRLQKKSLIGRKMEM